MTPEAACGFGPRIASAKGASEGFAETGGLPLDALGNCVTPSWTKYKHAAQAVRILGRDG